MKKKSEKICSVVGCTRKTRTSKSKLCDAHYNRQQQVGDLRVHDSIRPYCKGGGSGVCQVKGCRRRAVAHKLCSAHMQRKYLHGEVFPDIPISGGGHGWSLSERRHRQSLPAGRAQCSNCRKVQPLAAFSKDGTVSSHRSPYCKSCRRNMHLKREFGIDQHDYDLMLKRQNGCCALCGTAKPGMKRKYFCVDHNHVSGAVRGLLCYACNLHTVGSLEKRGITIKQLRDYLAGKFAPRKMNRKGRHGAATKRRSKK